jgi:hypothetical protein
MRSSYSITSSACTKIKAGEIQCDTIQPRVILTPTLSPRAGRGSAPVKPPAPRERGEGGARRLAMGG